MMKQYIVINSDLKMSHGKIARVCHNAGVVHKKISNFVQRLKWYANGTTTIVLKANDVQYVALQLELKSARIKYKKHIDAGHTQVEEGADCMTTFFSDKDVFTKHLKLY